MASFYQSLKDLFSQEMAEKIARVLEEKDTHINKAASHIIASLLGVMAKKGHTPKIRNIFEEAGNINLISDVGMFDEYLTHPQQKKGDNFLEQLLGDKAEAFATPISKESGISEVATNRLIAIIAPSFPAFFGEKMVKGGMSFQSVIDEIRSQGRSYADKIPADLIKAFGLSAVLNADKHQTVSNATTSSTTTTKTTLPEEKDKSKSSWVTWLFTIIVLCFIYFWWRSCNNNPGDMPNFGYEHIVNPVDVTPKDNPVASNAPAKELATTEISLPNGVQVRGYKNGVEEKMVDFLNSDAYKNATTKDLESKWFEFDNIDFEFGSTTKLKDPSKAQLNNIIAILKAYKDAKIAITSFTDKKEMETANTRVSKERVKAIEEMLEKGGVGSQIVKGKEYAGTQTENRDMAIRFVK